MTTLRSTRPAETVTASSDSRIEKSVLPGGVRVVTEQMPDTRSVTVGFWVGVGGRDEAESLSGASHFLEHLLFKGSERRAAREIAESVDAVGGEMNAFTAREHTAFYARLPERELGFALELLAEVVSSPALRASEVDAEREVILEEILSAEDTPEDRVHQALAEALFPGHPLGREVLGGRGSIEAMARDDIAAFHHDQYRPANLVVAAAGRLDHDDVVGRIDGFLDGGPHGTKPVRVAPPPDPAPLTVVHRPTEQAHVAIGWRAFGQDDPDRYALALLNHVLGGGMSSRLFQEVREQRGLVYSIYSFSSLYADAGALTVYAGTAPSKVEEVLGLIDAEVGRLLDSGITGREREVALGYLEGSFVLGLEDSGSRMARIGKSEVSRGEIVAVDQHLALLKAVTTDDVARVGRRILGQPRTLAALGPFDESQFAAG
ncbi:MAG: M16 family metallopeptidase [Acidimicrobiales bacterium]